jgi:NADH dehydrogenase/NADH:ubiquinone oxidoreductase subunit G
MISITIDGKRVRAKKGETVLQIAQRKGIKIPTLCHHKDLSPFGGCRLCIVQVKGRTHPLTACTLYPEHGMVIKTNTPRLRRQRKFTLQLILSEHPNACLICEREAECDSFQECIKKSAVTFGCKSCPQNGDCELQDLVEEFKIREIPFDFRYRNLEIERHDPFFDRDYNLCILCGRCIRACQEIRHAHTLDFHHRGPDTLVGTAFELPHLESGCQFCGACVDVCPTGALRDRFSRYEKPAEKTVRTTCMLCSLGCSINLGVNNRKITCSTPSNNQICVRGRFGIAPLVNHPKRITKPMLKKDNQLVEVEWDEAVKFVANKLQTHKNRSGILFSPQLTAEAIEKLYSLADSLKARLATPINANLTLSALQLKQIKGNVAFIILNTDMVADFSVLLLKLRKKFKNKASYVVIDSVENTSNGFADVWLNPKPGTEKELLRALVGAGRVPHNAGMSHEEIMHIKNLIADKKILLIYNASNFQDSQLPKSIKQLQLPSQVNTLKIAGYGAGATYEETLKNQNIDCLYTIGVASTPRKKYETVIVQDCFMPDSDFDVFLPAATFTETNGSLIDIEGKTRRLRRAIAPMDESRPDDWIIEELARQLNTRLTKPRKRKPTSKKATRVKTSKEYPLQLIVRENTYCYRNKTLSAVLKGFERLRHDRHVWLNEETAKRHKLQENMPVRIIGREVVLGMPVKISSIVPEGSVLIFHHPSMGHIENQPVRIECIKS